MTDEPHTLEQILSALSSGTHMSEAMREQVAEIVRRSVWKTIETAPKDGRDVLVYYPGFGMGQMVLFWIDGTWCEKAHGLRLKGEPTHFKLLGPPPDSTT